MKKKPPLSPEQIAELTQRAAKRLETPDGRQKLALALTRGVAVATRIADALRPDKKTEIIPFGPPNGKS